MLINFLSNVGWGYDEIEKKLKEWNEINEEPLKEVYILGQLRHYKGRKDKILPPNCDNKSYYEDMRVCNPDNLCNKVKNPVNYSLRKARFMKLNKKDDKGDKKEGSNDDKKANGKADGKVESKTEEGKGAITK
jgi:DNA primase large subunit